MPDIGEKAETKNCKLILDFLAAFGTASSREFKPKALQFKAKPYNLLFLTKRNDPTGTW